MRFGLQVLRVLEQERLRLTRADGQDAMQTYRPGRAHQTLSLAFGAVTRARKTCTVKRHSGKLRVVTLGQISVHLAGAEVVIEHGQRRRVALRPELIGSVARQPQMLDGQPETMNTSAIATNREFRRGGLFSRRC